MRHILLRKHELQQIKPYKVEATLPKDNGRDANLEDYMAVEMGGSLHHRYNMKQDVVEDNKYKCYVGGIQNTTHMTHKARQHFQEHARKNLEHQAQLHNMRMAQNPNFYKQEEKSDETVMTKIKTNLINFTNALKNGNVGKESLSIIQNIQEQLINNGHNLTSNDLIQIQEIMTTAYDIFNRDVLLDTLDTKDNSVYFSIKSVILSVIEITQEYMPYAEKSLRERKFAQKGIKINTEKQLLDTKKIMKEFGDTEDIIYDRLKYDTNYLRVKELKYQEKQRLKEIQQREKEERTVEKFAKKRLDVLSSKIASTWKKYKLEKRLYFKNEVIPEMYNIQAKVDSEKEDLLLQIREVDSSLTTLKSQLEAQSRQIQQASKELEFFKSNKGTSLSDIFKDNKELKELYDKQFDELMTSQDFQRILYSREKQNAMIENFNDHFVETYGKPDEDKMRHYEDIYGRLQRELIATNEKIDNLQLEKQNAVRELDGLALLQYDKQMEFLSRKGITESDFEKFFKDYVAFGKQMKATVPKHSPLKRVEVVEPDDEEAVVYEAPTGEGEAEGKTAEDDIALMTDFDFEENLSKMLKAYISSHLDEFTLTREPDFASEVDIIAQKYLQETSRQRLSESIKKYYRGLYSYANRVNDERWGVAEVPEVPEVPEAPVSDETASIPKAEDVSKYNFTDLKKFFEMSKNSSIRDIMLRDLGKRSNWFGSLHSSEGNRKILFDWLRNYSVAKRKNYFKDIKLSRR